MSTIKPNKLSVVVGRFQPLHNGHIELINHARSIADKTIVIIGSAYEAPSVKNPFSVYDRIDMVQNTFNDENIIIVGMEDFLYRDNIWYSHFTNLIMKNVEELGITKEDVVVVACNKDGATSNHNETISSLGFKVETFNLSQTLDATTIRNAMFEGEILRDKLDLNVAGIVENFMETVTYHTLALNYKNAADYRKSWETAPFPPTFVAVDAMIECRDYWGKPSVLLIRRKSDFGDGMLALPGGFLDVTESIYESCLRELKEETGLELDTAYKLQRVEVFDAPARSLRGRMITHCHHFIMQCQDSHLPVVTAGDDAGEAFWADYSFIANNKKNFYSDHYAIIAKMFELSSVEQLENLR